MGRTGMGTGFQTDAAGKIRAVLGEHEIRADFDAVAGNVPSMTVRFVHNGELHLVEIYSDSIVMLRGEALYEVYLKREFESARIYIESFAERLERYLRGEGWD